ncbi:transactivator protein [Sida micrantha mosaic virus-[snap bean:Brazil:2003]]|nr:transactivator protein [Sida micrantha mosaic virus-[snap bean:Brazil:2003]]
MLNSSSSTPPSIKPRHRIAKKRAIRRRRVDLECGCCLYQHLNCTGHGFPHRGIHNCTSGREWRIYLGDNKSPVFQDVPGFRTCCTQGHECTTSKYGSTTTSGEHWVSTKAYLTFQVWTTSLTASETTLFD